MIYAGRYVFLALLLVGGAYVGMAHAALPAAVAVHFDAQGHPNGWINPTSYLVILTVVGVVIPLGVVALVSFLALPVAGTAESPAPDRALGASEPCGGCSPDPGLRLVVAGLDVGPGPGT